MEKTKRSSIKSVAALAQTSVATVSRVLSNSQYPVSDELRQKVEAAAKELSFVPNSKAHTSSSTSMTIGLIVPTLSNPYYTQTIEGINAVCLEKGFGLMLCNTGYSPKLEEKLLGDMYARRVKGIIISSVNEESSTLSALIAKGVCVVQLDQHFEVEGCNNIHFNTKLGAQMAVRHLYEKGHRRIALVSKPLTRWTRQHTYQGYREELERLGLAVDEKLVFISDDSEELEQENYMAIGNKIVKQFLDARCDATAVFCMNDMMALGLIQGLHRQGVRVPDDVSVMGFDDIPYASIAVPPLTTIHCPSYETGRLAGLMLIDWMQNSGSNAGTINMDLQPKLVERESVKDINQKISK